MKRTVAVGIGPAVERGREQMSGEIVSALQDAASAHPEKAQEVLATLKEKWASLSDDDKDQVVERLKELRDKVADMSDDQKAEIADMIRQRTGV